MNARNVTNKRRRPADSRIHAPNFTGGEETRLRLVYRWQRPSLAYQTYLCLQGIPGILDMQPDKSHRRNNTTVLTTIREGVV